MEIQTGDFRRVEVKTSTQKGLKDIKEK